MTNVVEEQVVYKTQDGQVFDSPEDAAAHAHSLDMGRLIDGYLGTTTYTPQYRAGLRAHLLRWEAWRAGQKDQPNGA